MRLGVLRLVMTIVTNQCHERRNSAWSHLRKNTTPFTKYLHDQMHHHCVFHLDDVLFWHLHCQSQFQPQNTIGIIHDLQQQPTPVQHD